MNIDPRILQALLGQQGTFNANGQTQEYIDPATGLPYTLLRNYAQGSGDAGMVDRSQLMSGEIVSPAGQRNSLGYNLQNVYDQQGNFVREDDDGAGFGAFGDFVGDNMGAILAAIATMGVASAAGAGVGAAGSAAAPGAAGAAGSGGLSSITLPTMAEMGVGAATLTPELLATLPAVGGTAAAGGALGAAAGGGGGGGSLGAEAAFNPNGITDPGFGANASFGGTTAVGGQGGSIPLGGGGGMGGDWLSTLGQLGGAALGAYNSRDQQQTQSRDPWGPAQPALKGLLDQLQTLQQQYQQNPLSDLQRQAYGNQFGLLNAANQGAAGMLAGMQANAGGQNSYSRQNKGRSLVGSNPQWNWQPGLLNMGG